MNRKLTTLSAAIIGIGVATTGAQADLVEVDGGQTSVLLDLPLLETVGLMLSGASAEVIAPGSLGPDSVAFGINARNGDLPTTFSYDPSDFLGTFSGTIEHTGSVFFNDDTIEVGNFTIGFDGSRAGTLGGLASGFFVESTIGLGAVLFDVENPSELIASDTELIIGANLLVSPEFAIVLGNDGLAGIDVGDARVEGTVPAPGALAALIGAGLLGRRRRRSH